MVKPPRIARLVLPLDSRSNKLIVTRGFGYRWRMLVIDWCYFTIGLASMMVAGLSDQYRTPALMLLGALLGWSAFGRTRRALSYWTGWLDGRQAMFASLAEATKREMPFTDWLDREADRSLAVAGYDVTRPVPGDAPE